MSRWAVLAGRKARISRAINAASDYGSSRDDTAWWPTGDDGDIWRQERLYQPGIDEILDEPNGYRSRHRIGDGGPVRARPEPRQHIPRHAAPVLIRGV